MQCVPQITSVPFWTTLIPLAVVIGISAVKDGFDDIVSGGGAAGGTITCVSFQQRHNSDRKLNNLETRVLRDGKLFKEKWRTLQVGNVIQIKNDESVPVGN